MEYMRLFYSTVGWPIWTNEQAGSMMCHTLGAAVKRGHNTTASAVCALQGIREAVWHLSHRGTSSQPSMLLINVYMSSAQLCDAGGDHNNLGSAIRGRSTNLRPCLSSVDGAEVASYRSRFYSRRSSRHHNKICYALAVL